MAWFSRPRSVLVERKTPYDKDPRFIRAGQMVNYHHAADMNFGMCLRCNVFWPCDWYKYYNEIYTHPERHL